MHGLFVLGDELTVWTAHQFPVTMEAFRDIAGYAENFDHLRRRVKKITHANGDEGIELVGGKRLLFRARTKSGGRGLTANTVVLDEAFELTASMMGSLVPALSAVPNARVLYGSSAGRTTSDVLRSVRNRGRAGGDPSLVYVEFCAPVTACASDRCDHFPATSGCALDDKRLWARANPALGRRITVEHIEAERRSLPPEEFARERLGWWDEPEVAAGGMDRELWDSRRTTERGGELVGVAVDVTPDSRFAAVACAYSAGDGVRVEIVRHERGTHWAADAVAALGSRVPVAVDERGPASVVAPDLEARKLTVLSPTAAETSGACAAFMDGLQRGTVSHAAQPGLEAAVRGAVRSSSSDAWKWSRKSSDVDISPLVAATLAVWAARQPAQTKRPVFAF